MNSGIECDIFIPSHKPQSSTLSHRNTELYHPYLIDYHSILFLKDRHVGRFYTVLGISFRVGKSKKARDQIIAVKCESP